MSETKSGIIWIARIPPGVQPRHIRRLLEVYGKIERLYLLKERKEAKRKRRKKKRSGSRTHYVEGWVEYEDKEVAKSVAQRLHLAPMGGNMWFKDDLWNLKYLPDFTWGNLVEELNSPKKLKRRYLEISISESSRKNNYFLEQIEKGKTASQIDKPRMPTEAPQSEKKSSEDKKDAETDNKEVLRITNTPKESLLEFSRVLFGAKQG